MITFLKKGIYFHIKQYNHVSFQHMFFWDLLYSIRWVCTLE